MCTLDVITIMLIESLLLSKHSTRGSFQCSQVKLLVALLEMVIEIAILFTSVGPKNLYRKYTSPKITV